jgi:hypothetical protein
MVFGVAIEALVCSFTPVVAAAFLGVEITADLTKYVSWRDFVMSVGLEIEVRTRSLNHPRGESAR